MTNSTSRESIITVTMRSHHVIVLTNSVEVYVEMTSVTVGKSSTVCPTVILPVGEASIVILGLVMGIGLATSSCRGTLSCSGALVGLPVLL